MPNRLWTKDFTIITLGSAVSMLGNCLVGFAISLFVLDYTDTPALFAMFVFLYTLPQIVAPILAGPLMDHFSRRRTIYLLDFLSAGMYAMAGVLIYLKAYSFPFLAACTFLVGTVNSVYSVAFTSFYPLLITEGNFSKAYSVSSTLETFTCVMIPISTFLYKHFGISPLLMGTSLCFLLAACVETQISDVEAGGSVERPAAYGLKEYIDDSREGLRYLMGEKGLLYIALYFSMSALANGASSVITLPWFRMSFPDGEYVFMFVWAFMALSRILGSFIHYRWKLPAQKKFWIALGCYVLSSLIEGVYLYTSLPIMCAACFVIGLCSATSYNIRVSSTQSYVPNEKKGRFNGAFLMMTTVGSLLGELLSGILLTFLSMRLALMIFMGACALTALGLVGGKREYIKPIYNQET